MIKNISENRKKHNKEYKAQAFRVAVQNMSGDSSIRVMSRALILLRDDKTLNNEDIDLFKDKLTSLLKEHNKWSGGENAPTGESFVVFERDKDKDRTVKQLAQMIRSGQINRFVDGMYSVKSIDLYIDKLRNPKKHTKGFVDRFLVGISVKLAKILDKDDYFDALLAATSFDWKDSVENNLKQSNIKPDAFDKSETKKDKGLKVKVRM